ncbi:hypothetical protein [Nocardia sp. NPDC046763]|uniref:hypothetical protein n=1 Tax=Nocardia sp. NPDC046763 TaxID=3155256 RepID=UPI0033FD172F
MSEPPGPTEHGRGARPLRIGGIGLRRDRPDLVWRSASAAAVAEVPVPIGPGVSVTVDAADPAMVLGWNIAGDADPAPLLTACTEDVTTLIDTARSGAARPAGDPLRLQPSWVRRALVTAVTQRFPAPLHEGALLLDAATADQGVGDTALATATLGWAVPVLDELATAWLDGRITGAAATTLTEVARRCAAAAADIDLGTDIAAIAERLTVAQAADDAELLREMLESLADADDSELAFNLGGDAGIGSWPPGIDEELDLPAVPPRILRWAGAREREIRVVPGTVSGAGNEESVDIHVRLAADVDPLCREAHTLRAYAADGRDGRLLATAAMRPENRILVGQLQFHRPTDLTPVFGLYSADLGPALIRSDPTGRALRGVDRLMIDAWISHRAAVVAAATTGPRSSADLREQLRLRARGMLVRAGSLAATAAERLDALAERVSAADAELAARLDARVDAIDRYLLVLEGPATHTPSGMEPLLAEQIPVETDEGERP